MYPWREAKDMKVTNDKIWVVECAIVKLKERIREAIKIFCISFLLKK